MNPAGQNQFYDIAPPGQTIPPTSGRPIIVSNRPEQTDQMLQYPGSQPQYPAAPVQTNPMPAAPGGGIYAQPYEQPIPELPAAAQPYANYENPAPAGIYAPTQTAMPPNYAAPAANYYQPQPSIASTLDQMTANVPASTTGDQAYVYHSRSLLKSIIWLALLIFAIWLFFDAIFDWVNLNFLPHTHFTRL